MLVKTVALSHHLTSRPFSNVYLIARGSVMASLPEIAAYRRPSP
jgi:hypothetical protein